jgi:hypothetical protein
MNWIRRQPPIVMLVLIIVATIVGIGVGAGFAVSGLKAGPAQPIPFSHRIHAGNKKISCFFCHPYASVSSNAGLPSMEKCLLCHNMIASKFEPISRISRYNERKEGIPWVRVIDLPDFVRFDHQAHIAAGRDCGECHGNVKVMDRVTQAQTMDMNFCITCHQKNKVSVDCFLCHY